MFDSLFEKTRYAKVQLTVTTLAALYIFLIILVQYRQEFYPEPIPTLLEVSVEEKKLASRIETGIHINHFQEFSFTKNKFILDAIVWFKFAKTTESLATLQRFIIKNGELLETERLIMLSEPIIKILGDDVLVCFHVYTKFMANIHYKRFPISDHRLNIILENRSVTAREMYFESSPENIALSDDILVKNWEPKAKHTVTGFTQANLKESDPAMEINYPAVVFSIDFKSIGARDVISLYFPLFVIFFIGLLSLTVNIINSVRLGIIASSLPILVLFRMVIDNTSPAVGNTTHIDFIFYAIVFLSLLILFFQTYVMLELQRIKDVEPGNTAEKAMDSLEKLNNNIFFGIIFLLVCLVTYNYFR
ncbi:hypothetical protein K2X40_01610 [Candidatus Babeliales bacterium]|nr:hypothetical protein [Candidatus Babeliales bacterium]